MYLHTPFGNLEPGLGGSGPAEPGLRSEALGVLDSIREVVFRTDAEGRWTLLNAAWERITGFTVAESLGKIYLDFVHPDDRLATIQRFGALMSGEEESCRHDARYLTRDGGWRWIEAHGQATPGADGRPAGTSGTLTDNHDRRLAEEALRGSESRYRGLARILEDVIWEWDLVTDHIEWNASGRTTCAGHPVEEIGDYLVWWRQNLHPEDRPRVMGGLDAALEGRTERWQAEYRFRRGDGAWAVVLDRAAILRDATGKAVRMVGVMVEITDRVRADETTRFQASVLAAVPQAVVATDLEGRVTHANPAAEAMFGHSLAEAAGRPMFSLVHVADPEAARRFAANVTGGRSWGGQYWVKDARGRRKLIDAFGYPLRGGDGALSGTVALARDITDQHDLENQLREAQRLESVGRLAGGVAHEYNNLLTAISTYAELLTADTRRGSQERADLDAIRSAAREAAALTRQLLAFSRRQLLQPREVDPDVAIGILEPLMRATAPAGVKISIEPGGNGVQVRVDPGQLDHVVLNLVRNAGEAMPEGGTVTLRTGVVDGAAAGLGDASPIGGKWAYLSVTDTGVGIAPEHIPRLFEPFFSTKDQAAGGGLGLAMVYGTVRQSGGQVRVRSAPGEGSTFTIYFPVAGDGGASRDARDTEAAPGPVASTAGVRVLVVDDEAHLRGVVRRALDREGYEVRTAASGAEALEVWAEHGPMDLVVSDVVMPDLGGLELVRALRERGAQPKVLFVSGFTEDEAFRDHALPAGIPFLEKPFTLDGLARAVRGTLAGPLPAT